MPGRLFLTTPLAQVAETLGVSVEPVSDEPPRRNIAPGQDVITLNASGLQRMRWGMIPVGRVNARGRPVMETIINARSETLFEKTAYTGTARAVLPVDGWYERTGKTRRKTAWQIRAKDRGLLFFAAITDAWTALNGAVLHQLAAVTCEPSADVRDIHHRMGVLLDPADFSTWLNGTEAVVAPLMRPWPDGLLSVEMADDVDWSAP